MFVDGCLCCFEGFVVGVGDDEVWVDEFEVVVVMVGVFEVFGDCW